MKRSTPVEPVLPGCFDFYVVNTFGLIALPILIIRTFTVKVKRFPISFFYHVTSEFFVLYKALPLVYTEC